MGGPSPPLSTAVSMSAAPTARSCTGRPASRLVRTDSAPDVVTLIAISSRVAMRLGAARLRGLPQKVAACEVG